MAWITGHVRFDKISEENRVFNGDIILRRVEDLIIHGLVKEADGDTPVTGALVKVFARSAGGKELPLSHSFSSGDGKYLISVNKKRIPPGTAAIIVRAVQDTHSQG